MSKRIVSACIAVMLAWTVCTACVGESEELPSVPEAPAAEQAETEPEKPAENPEQPVQPAENPEQPAENPENPEQQAENPENPVQPENPEQPEQPAENPEQPVNPEQPAENPENPVQPEQPAENPENPVQPENPEQPEQPAENPEQPVNTEQPAENPERPEQPAEETPVCAHESTEVIYYFDFPDYRPLDADTHMVFGRATAEVRCTICRAILSSYTEENAEEICAHVFQKGVCVLCGQEQEVQQYEQYEAAASAPVSREREMIIPPSDDNPSQYFCALSATDLEETGDTLVLRPDGCDTAVVVKAEKLRTEIERTGGNFIAEIVRTGQRNVITTLRMYTADGSESIPEWQEISLRIYEANQGNPLVVVYTSPKGATSSEEAGWVGHGAEGYWNVTWLGNGIYEY